MAKNWRGDDEKLRRLIAASKEIVGKQQDSRDGSSGFLTIGELTDIIGDLLKKVPANQKERDEFWKTVVAVKVNNSGDFNDDHRPIVELEYCVSNKKDAKIKNILALSALGVAFVNPQNN